MEEEGGKKEGGRGKKEGRVWTGERTGKRKKEEDKVEKEKGAEEG